MCYRLCIYVRQYNCKDRPIEITNVLQEATPTDHTCDATPARHLTMEFVDGIFQTRQLGDRDANDDNKEKTDAAKLAHDDDDDDDAITIGSNEISIET